MKALTLIYVAVMTLTLSYEGVSGKPTPRPHRYRHTRSHRRYIHLQELIDRLDLRQKTDHIRITNLQEVLKEVQENGARNLKPLEDYINGETRKGQHEIISQVAQKGGEKDSWDAVLLKDIVGGARRKHKDGYTQEAVKKGGEKGTWRSGATEEGRKESSLEERPKNIEVSDQERQDEILLLREELAALRSEVRGLKEERAVEAQQQAAHSSQQQQRESVTAAWVVENVRRLQGAVEELQEAVNVTKAMHDKQEVESRLSVVGRDLAALRSSLTAVTSRVEATLATVETVLQEEARTAEDANHARGRTETLGVEVSDIREELNNLLSILPEGFTTAGSNTTKKDPNPSGSETVVVKASTARVGVLPVTRNTELTHDDAASTTLKDKASDHQHTATFTHHDNHQLEERVSAAESGLGEVRASSIQLLDAVEALEAQVETGVAEARQEVARLEYKVTTMQESGRNQVPSNKTEIDALTNRITQLETKISTMKVSSTPDNTAEIQALQKHVEELEYKLRVVEDTAKLSQAFASHSDSDVKVLSSRIDQLALFLASVDTSSISECRAKQLSMDEKFTEALTRLEALEREMKKS